MFPLDVFDELHVVSDLHMGGSGPGQMFDQGSRLAQWLEHLRSTAAERNVAVCLNGDTVDFLAEPAPSYFDGATAVAKLERIVADPAFAPVWKAMGQLVRTRRRTLIFTLGNHDLELALPWVREHLLTLLSGGSEAARGRIRLAFDGAGYLCRVGAARVFCIHGNDVDAWNRTDYETLRRQGRDGLLGRTPGPWTPNAGTKLVIDVMNEIKRQYPFVDLLKPEAEAVVPILYALRPDLQSKLRACTAVAAQLAWDSLRHELGFLAAGSGDSGNVRAAEEPIATFETDRAFEQLLHATFSLSGNRGSLPPEDPLLVQAERQFRENVEPLSLLGGDDARSRLGWAEATWNWITRKPPSEILRAALSGLARDQSFDVKHVDETYQRLDELVAQDIEFVITGHTHLERALRRRVGNGRYFNCGTWARLIRLSPDVLASPEQFARYDRAFRAGSMAALDAEPGLVLRRRTIVSIVAQGDRTQGEIQHLGAGPGLDLHPSVDSA